MEQEIVAVLFDAVGTLIEAAPPVAEVYRAAATRFGSRLSLEQIRDRFRRTIAAPPQQAGSPPSLTRPVTSEALERERWRSIVADVMDDVPTAAADDLFAELWEHFSRPTSWRLFDDVAPTWNELQQRGYTLGIASNFDSRLRSVLSCLPPLARCEKLFISSELGYPKPDPRFFAAVQSRLQLKPKQIVLVGDDWTNDVVGGKAAGWATQWLNRDPKAASGNGLARLTDLLSLLPPR